VIKLSQMPSFEGNSVLSNINIFLGTLNETVILRTHKRTKSNSFSDADEK
jgi:hypothetical protein